MEKTKQRKNVNLIVAIILCVICVPVIIVNTIMIIKTFVTPDHLPGIFGIKPAIVLSGSMRPLFKENALIFVKETDAARLKKDDVICFMQNGTAVTHRIEEVIVTDGETSYVTKGDANNTTDKFPVTPDEIEGIYVGHINGLGGAAMFMQSTPGIILVIGVPVLLYLTFYFIGRKKDAAAEKSRTAELEAELAVLKGGQSAAACTAELALDENGAEGSRQTDET